MEPLDMSSDRFKQADSPRLNISSAWWRFFGRLHPPLAAFSDCHACCGSSRVELVLCWKREAMPSPVCIASFCLWVGTVSAILATWTGWEMAANSKGIAANPVKADPYSNGIDGQESCWRGLSIALCLFWLINRISSQSSWSIPCLPVWSSGQLAVLVCVRRSLSVQR